MIPKTRFKRVKDNFQSHTSHLAEIPDDLSPHLLHIHQVWDVLHRLQEDLPSAQV